ncbi:MAG: Hpt domain-containing protein [Oscillospiraceae bacterium]|jgi:HPt (histidine-containing phosphotransfer) domain-containing protein|nr:Hpt domain-containing protein [Oscillospiraceae bacterium]
MLTIDALRRFGAKTEEGLGRCLNDEGFYLDLVKMVLEEKGFEKLASSLERGDWQAAFEAAHSLKGSLGNLALTPIYAPTAELTERLRDGREADYAALLTEILSQRDALIALRDG